MSYRVRCILLLLILLPLIPVHAAAEDEAVIHFNKGVSFYKAGKYDDAVSEFVEARKASPSDPLICNWIGFIYLLQKKYVEAIEPLERAVKLRPNYTEAHTNLGNAYLN